MTLPVNDKEESPAHTAVRLHEFLNHAVREVRGHLDKLDIALARR